VWRDDEEEKEGYKHFAAKGWIGIIKNSLVTLRAVLLMKILKLQLQL